MHKLALFFVLALCLPALAGASEPSATPRGRLYIIEGVGGIDRVGAACRKNLPSNTINLDVHCVQWGHGFGRWYKDLTDDERLLSSAQSLATEIAEFKREADNAPVLLIARSGGTAVAVYALELLEPNTIERVILLAPALSPTYELTSALRAVRRDVISFWSPHDDLVLGLGTRIFGTPDNVRTRAAGNVGFEVPAPAPPEVALQYRKLQQVPWSKQMRKSGHWGTHLGTGSPSFFRDYIAPLLTI